MKAELDLSNYAIKADLKNEPGVDSSKFVKKVDLASLKSKVVKLDIDKLEKVPTGSKSLKSKADKLDVDKLARVPVDLSKLRDVVKMMLLKKMYIMLRSKILKKKYLTLLTLATNTTLNAKINQVKNKICNITDLDTTAALTGIKNKIPDHSKYITTPEFN